MTEGRGTYTAGGSWVHVFVFVYTHVYTCICMFFCEPGTGVDTIQLLDRG